MKRMPYLPMIGVTFYVICWIISACMMPEWSFFNEWPSTLGTGASPGQLIFNTGMVVSGLLMAIYSYSLYDASESIWFRTGYIFSMVGGFLLCGVGIFNDDIAFGHELFTMSMFTISLMSIIYLGIYFYLRDRKIAGVFLIVTVACVCVSGLMIPLQGWDTTGAVYIDIMSFGISFAAWRYRFWELDKAVTT